MALKWTFVAFVVAMLAPAGLSKFTLSETFQGTTFFDNFNFITTADPTSGTVTYVSQTSAQSYGLINTSSSKAWMRVESSLTLGSSENRPSVRIESKNQYNYGLYIVSLNHMPTGCATWPAFWMYGPSWPAGGEIDIIEGVSNETQVHTTLHTSTGCDMTGQRTDMMTGYWSTSGSTTYTNCYVYAYGTSNVGCATRGKVGSIGKGFNKAGGGVYATVFNSTMIAVWMWNHSSVPSDLTSTNPNPLNWGLPQSRFPLGSHCTVNHFSNMWITFDTTLCGEWAGNTFGTDCPNLGSSWADCNTYVRNNPTAFKEAYWEVNYVKVYSWDNKSDTASSSCTLSALPTGATAWNTCSSSVASGSSCAFTCSSSYTAVTGTCSSGTWTTAPTCKACTATKTCSSQGQSCGSLWNGCSTVSCGACGSTSYCNGTKCIAVDLISEWYQVYPDGATTKNWAIASSVLTFTNLSLSTTQRVLGYSGTQTSWYSEGYNTVSVGVKATDGTVGLGIHLWQGDTRTLDRLEWKIVISGSTASSYYCSVYYGTATCNAVASGLTWKTADWNNFTVNYETGTTYINSLGWLNSNALVTSSMSVLTSRYKRTGSVFITAMGAATKSWKNMTVRSKTTVHVVLTNCMTTSQWTSFVVSLLGVSSSSVSTRSTLGYDSYCGSRKRDGESLFHEFLTTIADDEASSTSSKTLVSLLQEAIDDGAATWSGITVTSLATTLPSVTPGTIVGASSASALSTGAIVGIAVGGAAALALAGTAVGATVHIVKTRNNSERSMNEVEQPQKADPSHGGIDVMNPKKTRGSITGRAPPVEVEMPNQY